MITLQSEIVIRKAFLPFALPTIGEEEIAEVVDSLRSGWITTGPKVKQFESDLATYIGAEQTIAVNSCTAGLHIALTALGIGPGDQVIVPTLTFCSTANVIVHLGGHPVLVDVGSDGNIDPEAVEAAITPRTKAIMPVHYGGQACDLDAIYRLAAQYSLPVVEDAAHAIGAVYHGLPVGADRMPPRGVRRIVVFSFYATKNMTTGEGGMIATADQELAERMRLLTLHGMSHDAWKRYTSAGSWYYEVVAAGYKDNMTDIQAGLGIHQLRKLAGFIAARQHYASLYDQALGDLETILTPVVHPDRNHVYHLYAVYLQLDRLTIDRAQFIQALRDYNIGTSVHFIPVHMHPYYREQFGYRQGDLPAAEAIYRGLVSLPLYPRMTEGDVQYVIDVIRHILARHTR